MMLSDLVMLGGQHPYTTIAAVAVVCAYAVWQGTR